MKKAREHSSRAATLLVFFLGLYLIYIIMLPPEDAAAFFNETTIDNSSTGNAGDSYGIGLVGSADGDEIIGSRVLESIFVSYPITSYLKYHENLLEMKSNIFFSESIDYIISSDEDTEKTSVSFSIEQLDGANVLILLDSRVVASYSSLGKKSLEMDSSELNDTNKLEIKCDFKGIAFWKKQTCILSNASIYYHNYENTENRYMLSFDATKKEKYASKVGLNFSIGENTAGGDLVIKFNNEEVYRGTPSSGIYSAEKAIPVIDNNQIEISAETGGVYEIKKMDIFFEMGMVSEKMPTIDFILPEGAKDVKLKVYTKERILPPYVLMVDVSRHQVTYEINPLTEGWTEVEFDDRYMESENTLKLHTLGLFDITTAQVEYD